MTVAEGRAGLPYRSFIAAIRGDVVRDPLLERVGSPLVQRVRELLGDRPQWVGTTTELVKALERQIPAVVRQSKRPMSFNGLTRMLNSLKGDLVAAGIEITRRRSRSGRKWVLTF